jgi:site-specific DNA-adenine methylase
LNKDLINCWESVRDEPDIIIHLFEKFGKKFKKLSKEKKLDYCRSITSIIDDLSYDVVRASIYMLMKYCVYMGNLFVNNKFYFNGLDLNISVNNKFFFDYKKILIIYKI